jgi:hypothetical protein
MHYISSYETNNNIFFDASRAEPRRRSKWKLVDFKNNLDMLATKPKYVQSSIYEIANPFKKIFFKDQLYNIHFHKS